MQSIQSVIRNRIVTLPGLLSMACFGAVLALQPLAAQETKPEASQAPAVAQAAPAPASAQEDQASPAATQPAETKSGSERFLKINWTNTIKYSGAFRLTGQNDKLINNLVVIDPAGDTINADSNQDDGDRAFNKGHMITDRGDILSEIDLTYGNVGLHASGAAWGDAAYLGSSQNNSPETWNAYSVPNNKWPQGTRDLMLGHAELLDAFAFGKFNIGKSTLSVRGGQYALQWGESLFFGSNGIAGGMAPTDLIKLLGVPSSQFKEIILPEPQVSMQYQVTPDFAIGAFYKLGWQRTRFPPVGSYLSFTDILGQGAERLVVGGPVNIGPTQTCYEPNAVCTGPLAFWHSADREPKKWGQFGVQAKFRLPGGWDAGVYGLQYNERAGQLYMQPLGGTQTEAQFLAGQIGNFYWAFPENIKAIAVSATKSRGSFNWAGELGAHFNQDLVSDGGTDLSVATSLAPPQFQVPKPDANAHPLYAVGKTIHGQVSWIASLGKTAISKEASWAGEIAWNMLESVDKNPMSVTDTEGNTYAALDPNTRKHAVGIRTTYAPTYRQVFSGADITWTVGGAYFPMSRSSVVNGFGPNKGGDYSAGIDVAYLYNWHFGATLTGYYGKVGGLLDANNHYNMLQDFADRYNLSFNIRRTIGFNYKQHAK